MNKLFDHKATAMSRHHRVRFLSFPRNLRTRLSLASTLLNQIRPIDGIRIVLSSNLETQYCEAARFQRAKESNEIPDHVKCHLGTV